MRGRRVACFRSFTPRTNAPALNLAGARADLSGVTLEKAVHERGMRDTREALARWNERPLPVFGRWVALAAATACALLVAVVLIADAAIADPSPLELPGVTRPAEAADALHILARNALVLALHALACVAGFIAGSSLPQLAAGRRGLSRVVHERAGPLALAFVGLATAFSLVTQAWTIGNGAAAVAAQLGVAPATLVAGLLPHALPELTALFLPLAAWWVAARAGRWRELLAAAAVTTAIAVPVLLACAAIELTVSPRLLTALGAG